jgi:alanyl-tRNA synthetase
LWVSVYREDDESYSIWVEEIGVPEKRIVKLDARDNFWPSDAPMKGPNGPCGPCSEIFYDWGEETGCKKESCGPACDCGRFVEVWNLVFTEFERKPDGKLVPLPHKNIDTGMGLERIASVTQNVRSNFETDIFIPITEEIKKVIGGKTAEMDKSDIYLIADHIRAITFSIADGVSPSNEKRGYVIRKLIRRAYLRNPEKKPFLYKLVPKVTSVMKEVYPDTEDKREHISAIVEEEEKRFNDTLMSTMPVMESMIAKKSGVLSGGDIFKLVDTYGMPLDVIEETAEEKNVKLDTPGFELLMEARKEQSRRSSDIVNDFIFQPDLFEGAPNPELSDRMPLETKIEFILKQNSIDDTLRAGDVAEVILSPQSSLFYAEAGGQAGDTGIITGTDSFMRVLNTYQTHGRKVLYVSVDKGVFKLKDKVVLSLDAEKKRKTAGNHTATHLLQAALRAVLGEHVKQSGSAVDEKRLRFDFTHLTKIPERELIKIERMVNTWIDEDIKVNKEEKSLEEAKKEGSLSFFGEKYSDVVRVITVGAKSKELCGGTHVDRTSDIGVFKITAETSVASGIRRIEAVTGKSAENWIQNAIKEYLAQIDVLTDKADGYLDGDMLDISRNIAAGNIPVDKEILTTFEEKLKPAFVAALEVLNKEAKDKEKSRFQDRFNSTIAALEEKIAFPENIKGIKFFASILEDADMGLMRKVVKYMEKKISRGIIFLAGRNGEKASLICAISGDPIEIGVKAGDIIKKAAEQIEGRGGGKDNFAQAGGTKVSALPEALEKAREMIREKV